MSLRLGFLVGTAEEPDLGLLTRLGQAALAAGHEVRIFLMHEGIAFSHRPELAALVEAGAEATLCGTNATWAGLDVRGAAAAEGSQLDHAALVRDCDRVVSLC
ncbi:MAG TPA: hypothetical protein VKN99_07240 [Polyangia bacterium]|nr:hypothetical protein [Polyangia bacterium]